MNFLSVNRSDNNNLQDIKIITANNHMMHSRPSKYWKKNLLILTKGEHDKGSRKFKIFNVVQSFASQLLNQKTIKLKEQRTQTGPK